MFRRQHRLTVGWVSTTVAEDRHFAGDFLLDQQVFAPVGEDDLDFLLISPTDVRSLIN